MSSPTRRSRAASGCSTDLRWEAITQTSPRNYTGVVVSSRLALVSFQKGLRRSVTEKAPMTGRRVLGTAWLEPSFLMFQYPHTALGLEVVPVRRGAYQLLRDDRN